MCEPTKLKVKLLYEIIKKREINILTNNVHLIKFHVSSHSEDYFIAAAHQHDAIAVLQCYAIVSWYIVDDHRHHGNRHSQRSRNVVATFSCCSPPFNPKPSAGEWRHKKSRFLSPKRLPACARAQVTSRQQSKRERSEESGEDKFKERAKVDASQRS